MLADQFDSEAVMVDPVEGFVQVQEGTDCDVFPFKAFCNSF